jgi:hypothetical protein
MRTITTTAGTTIEIDGDVLAILETISRDLVRRRQLDYVYEDVEREFEHVTSQLTVDELKMYLKESLFMSFNRFETERMLSILKKAESATEES